MNLNNSVTHCVAAESKGIKFQAAKRRGDIIHYSWLLDCCSQKKLLPLQPKYFLVLSDSSKKKLQEEIDDFSDSYFCDIDTADLKQILSNIDSSEESKTLDYYKKKFCPKDKWSCFHGCCIYFYLSSHHLKSDWKALLEVALRRMKLEVSFGGGKVCDNLSQASHFVVTSLPGFNVEFDAILKSFSAPVRHLLCNKRLHVVESKWLEDCFEKEHRLQEEAYSLKPNGLNESTVAECKHGVNPEDYSSLENVENPKMLSSSDKDGKERERKSATVKPSGRSSRLRTNKGKAGFNQPRRARTGTKPAKIYENESDANISSDENTIKQSTELGRSNYESHGKVEQKTPKIEDVIVEDSDRSSFRASAEEQEIAEHSRGGERLDKVSEESEKLEAMVDPVNSMLLDMIPSLGMKKVESAHPVTKRENPSPNPNPEPAKKKKVSYKDWASELLRD